MEGLQVSYDITIIALSGLVGTVNYWIYNQLNLLDFFDQSKADEKITMITLLGFLTFPVYLVLEVFDLNLVWAILIAWIVSFFVQGIVLWLIRKLSDLIKSHFYVGKRNYKYFNSGLEQVLNSGESKYCYAFIYNFEGKLIEQGFVSHNSNDVIGNEVYMSLESRNETEEEINEYLENVSERFVDFKNKVKIHIIFFE